MSVGTGSVGSTKDFDLMGIVTREITPDVIDRAAIQTGEGKERTISALRASVPSVLATLSDVVSSDGGAAHLKHIIDERGRLGGTASAAFSSLSGREQGVALFDGEAGDRSGSISAAVARTSGIKPESAHELLGGVTSVAMLALGKTGAAPETLKRAFSEQRGGWVQRLPGPLASLFGERRAAAAATGVTGRAVEEEREVTGPAIRRVEAAGRRGWIMPLLLLAALALIAIPLIRGLRRPPVSPPIGPLPQAVVPKPELVPLALPNGETVSLPRGSSTYELANYLAGSEPTPRRFTLSPLNFEFGSTRLTPESLSTVQQLSAILTAYPTTAIRVESHTDNIGTPESNLDLSTSRSEAVKGQLASRGVDVSRVEVVGLGQQNPIATNDTAEGRAQNRRTDVVVTGR
jgi:outer membrane protein OmpA-like peptidoglycan-associated protein